MGTTTAFAEALAKRTTTTGGHCCRVGELVAKLDAGSQADYLAAQTAKKPGGEWLVSGVALADSLNDALRTLDIHETVSETVMRNHRNKRHVIA